MTQPNWYGLVEDEGTTRAWGFAGTTPVQSLRGDSPADLTAKLGQVPVLPVLADGPLQPVPAACLPEAGPLLALTQDRPRGILPAAVRLRLLGLVSQHPNWDGTACVIAGGHSHWVQISADEVVSFQSFLTPRLIQGLAPDADTADAKAAADTLSRPERLATHLSSAELIGDPAAMLGHLIGAELAATRPYWLGQQVALIGAGALPSAYAATLSPQGVPCTTLADEALMQAGLLALKARA